MVTALHWIWPILALIARDKVLPSGGDLKNEPLQMQALLAAPDGSASRYSYSGEVRFHWVSSAAAGSAGLIVQILPEDDDQPVWTHEFSAAEPEDIWTRALPRRGRIKVVSATQGPAVPVVRDSVLIDAEMTQQQGVTGSDDRQTITSQSDSIQGYGKSIARLRWVGADKKIHACTGFLVAQDLLLTNQHCMKTSKEIDSTSIDFDYDKKTSKLDRYAVRRQEFSSERLDVSLYSLNRPASGRELLPWSSAGAGKGETLILIQYPGGNPKMVSLVDCRVVNPDVPGMSSDAFRDFSHECDTSSGASGSPVLDLKGAVVGVHHNGFDGASDTLLNEAIKIENIKQVFSNDPNPVVSSAAKQRSP